MVRVFCYAHWDILHQATCGFDVDVEVFLGMNHAGGVSTKFCTFNVLGIVRSRDIGVQWILGLVCRHDVCVCQYVILLRASLKFRGAELTVSISRIASDICLLVSVLVLRTMEC